MVVRKWKYGDEPNADRTLILAGADVNAAPHKFDKRIYFIEDPITALLDAVMSNNHQFIFSFLKNSAEINDSRAGKTALETATKKNGAIFGRYNFFFQLMQIHKEINPYSRQSKQDIELIRTLNIADADLGTTREQLPCAQRCPPETLDLFISF